MSDVTQAPSDIYKPKSRRQMFEVLRAQLENERSSFIPHWRDLGDHLCPRRPRLNVTDVNRGNRMNQKIIDSTGLKAAKNLRAGMMGGITSPARPWFKLAAGDAKLNDIEAVKTWLFDVTNLMAGVFIRSNLYNALPTVYLDLGSFSTGAKLVEEDLDEVLRFYPLPIGSYMVANNDKLKVDVFMRDFRMTVRQLIQKFGLNNPDKPMDIDWTKFSETVKNLWAQGNTEVWVDVVHAIIPNPDFDPKKLASKYKKYLSVYYERGFCGAQTAGYGDQVGETYLREAGYDYFPVLCPRWETTGEDVYGTNGPGMESLGDNRALQVMQKRKAQGIDKQINPPMRAPGNMKNQSSSTLPGGVTYVDGDGAYAPAYQVQPDLNGMVMDIRETQLRIKQAFFEDLFLMFANTDRREITAAEVQARQQEKLLALGPVLEQLNQDLLDPLIDIAFVVMMKQGLIPPPPEELQGAKLRVEYTSIMAQAQKLSGIETIERFLNFATAVIAQNPETRDKVNFDELIDKYGDRLSVDPGLIHSDEDVEGIRAQRAQAAQAQQKAQMLQQGAATAKELSQTQMGGNSALDAMLAANKAGALA